MDQYHVLKNGQIHSRMCFCIYFIAQKNFFLFAKQVRNYKNGVFLIFKMMLQLSLISLNRKVFCIEPSESNKNYSLERKRLTLWEDPFRILVAQWPQEESACPWAMAHREISTPDPYSRFWDVGISYPNSPKHIPKFWGSFPRSVFLDLSLLWPLKGLKIR